MTRFAKIAGAAAIALAAVAAAQASQTTRFFEPWHAVITQMDSGDLAAAREALAKIDSAGRSGRRWRAQLEAAIRQREELARSLVGRAAAAVEQGRTGAAIRHMDLALMLDRRIADFAPFAGPDRVRRQRDKALAEAGRCTGEHAAACLSAVLTRLRAIAPGDGAVLLLELGAGDNVPERQRPAPARAEHH